MTRAPLQITFRRLVALNWVSGVCGGLIMWGITHPNYQRMALPLKVSATAETDGGFASIDSSGDAAWGDLEIRDIEIERPPEFAAFDISPDAPSWTFEGATREDVRQWMEDAKVPPLQIARALSPKMLTVEGGKAIVRPDDELIFSLSPESRASLYRVLGQWLSNPLIHDPFRGRPGDIQRWCASDKIPAEIAGEIQQLLYTQGDTECFSDYATVMRHMASPDDRLNLTRTLSRQRTLLLRLHIRPTTDIDKFLGYWTGKGVRQKDLRPLAEALKRLPDGGSMGIAYALPPFARERLYTFPMPDLSNSKKEDCHWTTLNFFNDPPDDRFYDGAYLSDYIKKNFYLISAATHYGDRVFFLDGNGNAIHSAVYVAGDIVFTKNGIGPTQPWVLMHIKDVFDAYGGPEKVNLMVYRENDT